MMTRSANEIAAEHLAREMASLLTRILHQPMRTHVAYSVAHDSMLANINGYEFIVPTFEAVTAGRCDNLALLLLDRSILPILCPNGM